MVLDRRRKNTLLGHGKPPDPFARAGEPFGSYRAAVLYRRSAHYPWRFGGEFMQAHVARRLSPTRSRVRTVPTVCVRRPLRFSPGAPSRAATLTPRLSPALPSPPAPRTSSGLFFFLIIRPPPSSTLFPHTPLSR